MTRGKPAAAATSRSTDALRQFLNEIGFARPQNGAVVAVVRVVHNALIGSKAMRGQIVSIEVLETKVHYDFAVDAKRPPDRWIDDSAVLRCA